MLCLSMLQSEKQVIMNRLAGGVCKWKRFWIFLKVGGGWACFAWKTVPRIFHFLYLHFLMNTMKHVDLLQTIMNTPRKIKMEPDKTPLEEENHLNQTIIFGCYVKLRGGRWQFTTSPDVFFTHPGARILPIHLKNPPTATAEKSLSTQKGEAGWSWILQGASWNGWKTPMISKKNIRIWKSHPTNST